MNLADRLYGEGVYDGFDPTPWPEDMQGWGSDHPVFRTVIEAVRPRLIVEVGSWKGASAIHMARLADELGLDTQILCVDTWLGSPEHFLGKAPGWRESLQLRSGMPHLYYTFLANVVRSGLSHRIVPLAQTSDNAAVILRELGLRPDLVYIDAAHEEGPAYQDFSAYWPLLGDDGVLLGDDYISWEGVTRAANRFAVDVARPIVGTWGKFVITRSDALQPRIALA